MEDNETRTFHVNFQTTEGTTFLIVRRNYVHFVEHIQPCTLFKVCVGGLTLGLVISSECNFRSASFLQFVRSCVTGELLNNSPTLQPAAAEQGSLTEDML